MIIFLSLVISAISNPNGPILRQCKEGKSKQCWAREKEAIGIVKNKKVMLNKKDRREKGGDWGNKIGFINENLKQKI